LDAYVFAGSATTSAISTLLASVSPSGPARVVCPLSGDRAVYVAIEAADQSTLQQRINAVTSTSGLSNVTSHVVSAGQIDSLAFPTHALVQAFVGFAMLSPNSSATASLVANAVSEVEGVCGLAIVGTKVLVEVTASTSGGVEAILGAAAEANNHIVEFTAIGDTGDGAGFPTS